MRGSEQSCGRRSGKPTLRGPRRWRRGQREGRQKDRNFVIALARGFEVLRAFKPTDGMLGNQEIAARTKLPKPTVSRLTYTLTRLGYLTHLARLENQLA